MSETNLGTQNTRWDLSFLYSGITDPQLDLDIDAFTKLVKKFNESYRGKLGEKLGQAIQDYSEITTLQSKIGAYLYLLQSLDVTNTAVKAKIARTDNILSHAAGEYMSFFAIEIVALEDSNLERLYSSDSIVARHKPWIEHLRIFKPHFLTEEVESALTKRDPFGFGAWSEFFDEVEADLEFDYKDSKKTLTEMLDALSESRDATERAAILGLISNGLKGSFAKYSAQTLYMVTGSNAVENRERGYKHPMEATNKSNRIPDEVVDTLHRVVMAETGPLVKRFYQLKAVHLGLKTLKWSDRNAAMPFADTSIVPFDDGIKTVLEAYESFSPTLADLVREFMKNKRIDAPVSKGRRGGAYNSSVVLPGNLPASFTFLNYLGSNRDVMTLAHELGHGVHGVLAGQAQGPLMYQAPMAYAETASVFGEMTTFNFLKKRLVEGGDKKSLLALIMSKIDDGVNTIVRQIGFSNFERRIHGMNASYTNWSEPQKLSVDELSAIWLETTKELYGQEGEVFTYENAEYLWSYVSHFHRAFYVYAYAFGQILTESLYAQQARFGDKFEPLYLDLLRSGSTRDVVQLLEPFGLDPKDENFWIQGIRQGIGRLIDEAEQISKELGIKVG